MDRWRMEGNTHLRGEVPVSLEFRPESVFKRNKSHRAKSLPVCVSYNESQSVLQPQHMTHAARPTSRRMSRAEGLPVCFKVPRAMARLDWQLKSFNSESGSDSA